jgi:hypothetical protein
MAGKENDKGQSSREPFVSQGDRPEVRIKLDAPISELRVRDLATILGLGTGKDFWDGKDWQKDDFDGGLKWWKEKEKDKDKLEKFEHKELKIEKHEHKELKLEKHEHKELKLEKLENDGQFEVPQRPGPDPWVQSIFKAIAGLTEQVSQLTDQVAQLQKERKG